MKSVGELEKLRQSLNIPEQSIGVIKPQEIRNIRKCLKLTQTDFGLLFNVSFATISRWEIGDRKPSSASVREQLLILKKRFEE